MEEVRKYRIIKTRKTTLNNTREFYIREDRYRLHFYYRKIDIEKQNKNKRNS